MEFSNDDDDDEAKFLISRNTNNWQALW